MRGKLLVKKEREITVPVSSVVINNALLIIEEKKFSFTIRFNLTRYD